MQAEEKRSESSHWDRSITDEIGRDAILTEVLRRLQMRMRQDTAHDVGHAIRVALWTVRLAAPAITPRLCIATALLHDVVNLRKDDPARGLASSRSADVAADLLADLLEPEDVLAACSAIRDHSYTRGVVPHTLLGRALQDADRLDALGVIGMFRCIVTGTQLGATIVDYRDPWAIARPLDDRRFCIDHVFVKLWQLRDTLHTDAARSEADRRIASMRRMLDELSSELASTAAPSTEEPDDIPRST